MGSLGQELVSLASFALFLAGYDMQSIDFTKGSSVVDGMKSLFRQAGLEGKPIGVIIKVCAYYNHDTITQFHYLPHHANLLYIAISY